MKGKCGRGAGSKTIVFGLFKRNGKVYTEIVSNVSRAALQAIIRGRASLYSVIYLDGWREYNSLVDVGYEKYFRVNHSENAHAYNILKRQRSSHKRYRKFLRLCKA